MFPPKGEMFTNCELHSDPSFEFIAKVDQEYLVIGSHVDELTQSKIIQGEYIDFSKLIPRDKILAEEDSRLELVIKNGRTFWSPVSETVTINCFSRWEQAFRIFMNIYTRAHPKKSSELIQYNHIIHSISLVYIWDNVYSYDKEFRLHLSKYPEWNWSVIMQQAWSMKLRDRLPKNIDYVHNSHQGASRGNNYQNQGAIKVNLANQGNPVDSLTKAFASLEQGVALITDVPIASSLDIWS